MIYADLEYLLKKIDSSQSDLKKSSTEKKTKHKPSVTHRLHAVHWIHQKTNVVITEEKTVWNVL